MIQLVKINKLILCAGILMLYCCGPSKKREDANEPVVVSIDTVQKAKAKLFLDSILSRYKHYLLEHIPAETDFGDLLNSAYTAGDLIDNGIIPESFTSNDQELSSKVNFDFGNSPVSLSGV
jgi:hypothetical protein